MKKHFKNLSALLLMGTMVMNMTACGKAEEKQGAVTPEVKKESTDTGKKAEEEQITITLWHQSVADTDPVKRIIEDSVEEYHALHPNITIVQDGVTGEQYKTKIKTAFAAGEAPDIAYMFGGGSFVKPYIDAGYLLPIDEYLTEDTKSKILDGMLENCMYNGKTYTLPTITFLANLYCNTEMFEKAGAEYPTTWEELLEASKKLRAAGYTPIILGEKIPGQVCIGMILFQLDRLEMQLLWKHLKTLQNLIVNLLSRLQRRCKN
ncbi:ABC transporter substrate-binding protein [Sporanaerobium hydrogeniformans]|uniref:ABC transporter substrate-binding protein n=1 Tax=Sporanaerobium hydrogeniformans TaxID=3072179 RepID=UPI002683E848|nr:extracellular solute-binding protein [Sporanaerobium hydrogeniformans]